MSGLQHLPLQVRSVAYPPLTVRQAAVYEWIREFIGDRGRPPTWREVALFLGSPGPPASLNAVSDYLKALEHKGFIVLEPPIVGAPGVGKGDRHIRIPGVRWVPVPVEDA